MSAEPVAISTGAVRPLFISVPGGNGGKAASECNDVIRSAHVSRGSEQQANASRGSLIDCFVAPFNPPVPSSNLSVGRGFVLCSNWPIQYTESRCSSAATLMHSPKSHLLLSVHHTRTDLSAETDAKQDGLPAPNAISARPHT